MTTNTNTTEEALAANARLLQRRKEVRIATDAPGTAGPDPRTPEQAADFSGVLERLKQFGEENAKLGRQFRAELQAKKFRQETCDIHGSNLFPNEDESVRQSVKAGELKVVWHVCAECFQVRQGFNGWKIAAGIPAEFVGATVDNWTPRDPGEIEILRNVRAFLKARSRFLIMLGNKGTGKTHLAAGILEHFRRGVMVTQSSLLYQLRESYGKHGGTNVIERCQKAAVLVIDDMGLSVGGKDELPMLHEILSFRHSQFLPTVLTGNIKLAELFAVIGERMVDRLSQSLFCNPLNFSGASNRPARKNDY